MQARIEAGGKIESVVDNLTASQASETIYALREKHIAQADPNLIQTQEVQEHTQIFSNMEQFKDEEILNLVGTSNQQNQTHIAAEISMDFKKLDLANNINQINNISQGEHQ